MVWYLELNNDFMLLNFVEIVKSCHIFVSSIVFNKSRIVSLLGITNFNLELRINFFQAFKEKIEISTVNK